MGNVKIIEVNQNVFAENDMVAESIRSRLTDAGTYMVNLMASPGAGKTSLILGTADRLKGHLEMGVMEADIEAAVDAQKMEAAGIRSIQIHTGGECAMNADMTGQGLEAFDYRVLDLLILENVGNLVCPAETDTGAHLNAAILSVPEGDDKPLKYPLMFTVCDAVIINKIDTTEWFPFDKEAVVRRIQQRNPDAEIFFVSAKTGEGMDDWAAWLYRKVTQWKNDMKK